jgi:hypothetical protein
MKRLILQIRLYFAHNDFQYYIRKVSETEIDLDYLKAMKSITGKRYWDLCDELDK